MKILITGHKGFVGTHTTRALNKHDIVGIDKKAGGDITAEKFLHEASSFKPDMIVHLAADCSTTRSITNPALTFKDITVGNFVICELARITGAKVLYTSSCKAKRNPHGIRTPYGLAKYVGELYLEEYGKVFGVDYLINRPGTIYGPGQEGSAESGWLSWFIKASKENFPIIIYGDGKQSRDVLWVDDYVRLMVDQVDNWDKYQKWGKTFEVGGGEKNEVNLLDVLKFLKYDNFTHEKARVGDMRRTVSDNVVTTVNDWEPKIGWEEGIRKLL